MRAEAEIAREVFRRLASAKALRVILALDAGPAAVHRRHPDVRDVLERRRVRPARVPGGDGVERMARCGYTFLQPTVPLCRRRRT